MVGVGVIGCGYWGPNLVRVFHESAGARVAAVCDLRADRLGAITRRYPTIRCYFDAKDLVTQRDVDLVVIATGLESHHSLAKLAIEHGKHVLVEKPFTRTVAQAEELIDLANGRGVLIAVDHTFLFTPAIEKTKELLQSGRLGALHYVDSVRISLGLIQEELNVIWDLAPHDFSILDFLIGRLPDRVVATGASHTRTGQVDVAYINLDYGNGLIANVHANWLSPVKVRRMILGGERQMIIFDDLSTNEKLRVFDSGATCSSRPAEKTGGSAHPAPRVDYRVGDIWTPYLPPREALAVEAEHVISAIRDGAPLRADGASGLRVVRILEACERSLQQDGARVMLNSAPRRWPVANMPLDSLTPFLQRSPPVYAESSGLIGVPAEDGE